MVLGDNKMKQEQDFKRMHEAITMLRIHRDDKSVVYRLRLINELNNQIESIVIENIQK